MKTRETEIFIKSLFLNLFILNLVFFYNVWDSPYLSLSHYLTIDKYLLFFNFSWILTQFVFFSSVLMLRNKFTLRALMITYKMTIFILISSLSLFFITPETINPKFFLGFWAGFYITSLVFEFVIYNYLKRKYNNYSKLNRVIVIGFNDTGQFFQMLVENNPILGYKFIGFLNDEFTTNQSVIGHTDKLAEYIVENKIQTVFVVESLFTSECTLKFLEICDRLGVRLWLISDNNNLTNRTMKKKSVDCLILNNSRENPLDNFGPRIIKRTFDIAFSFLVIVFVLSWMFPILALLIKLGSKGPILFIQKRTGLNNTVFDCYKFRTMCVNDKSDILQASDHDYRITKIGHFLRKTNIDEFPQFINVFLGQMSVVGPRPHMLKHTEEYSSLINGYLIRHFVKPGITGWAQVNGLHGETDKLWKMEKRVEYDINYMNTWTFWLDVKIIPMTLFSRKKYFRILNLDLPSQYDDYQKNRSKGYFISK